MRNVFKEKRKNIIKNYDIKKKALKKKIKQKKKRSKFESSEVVMLLILTMLVSVFMTSAATIGLSQRAEKDAPFEHSEEFKNFIRNYEFIIENYYGEIDEAELLNDATKSILEALGDPFSNMIDAPAGQDTFLEGRFRGIGVEVVNDNDGNILVLRTFEGSAANDAGIKGGEVLVSIDDVDLLGENTEVLVEYVAGKEGPFEIVASKDGEETTYTLEKRMIVIPSVHLEVLEENDTKIGYMRIDLFSETTLSQFRSKLNDLDDQNIDELVIDLRSNSGGHLSVVYEIASLLLEEGMVVYKTDDGENVNEVKARNGKIRDYNISFLSNGGSASASELMMAALRENIGSKIYGETTYGKGTVQQIREVSDGNNYTITIKRWLTPDGNWVQEGGLKPDIEIVTSDEFYMTGLRENDNLLLEVIEKISE